MTNKKINLKYIKYKRHKKYNTRYKIYQRKKILDQTINFLSIFLACIIFLFLINRFLFYKLEINIPKENIAAFQMPVKNFFKLKELSEKYNLAFNDLITVYSLENNFFPNKSIIELETEIEKKLIINYSQTKKKYNKKILNQYSSMFKNILAEIKYFPIPADICTETDLPYIFGDNWEKKYIEKIPQGSNIFDRENICGRIPIVSMTDGKILKINWDDNLGYNILINTSNNNKYLYCHLDKFAEELKKNSKIIAGQLLGYMGNSKKENTKKIVHLHLCINPKTKFADDDFYINPYLFLRLIEPNKISLDK